MKTQINVGVIVGRFQVDSLHKGHRSLFDFALTQNDEVLVVLGSTAGLADDKNPLSFNIRKQMILGLYPTVKVIELIDQPSDELWSVFLDRAILDIFPTEAIRLYGSRDSFLKSYRGQLRGIEMQTKIAQSGSKRRQQIRERAGVKTTKAMRQGVIYAHLTRLPMVYPTVDIAILNEEGTQVLLGQKAVEGDKWRFPGGFVDVTDKSLVQAARREAREETGQMELDDFQVIGSTQIIDWRYKDSGDSIITTFFTAKRIWGKAEAGDDLNKVQWTPINSQLMNLLVEAHHPLGEMLLERLGN